MLHAALRVLAPPNPRLVPFRPPRKENTTRTPAAAGSLQIMAAASDSGGHDTFYGLLVRAYVTCVQHGAVRNSLPVSRCVGVGLLLQPRWP